MSDKSDYQAKIEAEKTRFAADLDVHALPEIFHYWSHNYVRPMLEEVGFNHPDELFAKFLHESSERSQATAAPVFLSIGAGNCDTEVRVAQRLLARGLSSFKIECLDLSPVMLTRGRDLALAEGVGDHLSFTEGDFNTWSANRVYDGAMANQSLHHVLHLEHLFDELKLSLAPAAYFVTSDMIGRNGHQRWPEAFERVQRFWSELPMDYRQNLLLNRYEEIYENWDCSDEGFEGIRAQDVLPLLLERFNFYIFAAFGNTVDPFVDRCFGHHFDATGKWDRRFIDRVHEADEQGFRDGTLTPTHMMAVMTAGEPPERRYARGMSPEAAVRRSDA
jgi:SAM-dependent methyltransferase